MRVVLTNYDVDGEYISKVIEKETDHPVIGERVILSTGAYVVRDVAWMYDLCCPNVTVFLERVISVEGE